MSEAIYSKDKVFDLWCSEVDWVGKEFRSRSKGEGEWGPSDKQALIGKITQQNNCQFADFFWKYKTNMSFFQVYVLFPDSLICRRRARQCHICPWETFISLRLSYTTMSYTMFCLHKYAPSQVTQLFKAEFFFLCQVITLSSCHQIVTYVFIYLSTNVSQTYSAAHTLILRGKKFIFWDSSRRVWEGQNYQIWLREGVKKNRLFSQV